MCYSGIGSSSLTEPLPPELPPRAPLDEPDGCLVGGVGAGLATPFAETPDATGEERRSSQHTCITRNWPVHWHDDGVAIYVSSGQSRYCNQRLHPSQKVHDA